MKFKAPNGEVIETDNKNILNIFEREGFIKVEEEKPKKKLDK